MCLLAAETEKGLVLILVGFLQWAGENWRELGGMHWTRCADDLRRGEPLCLEEGGVTFYANHYSPDPRARPPGFSLGPPFISLKEQGFQPHRTQAVCVDTT